MSSGALIQLNHRGYQDTFITGNPEYNFIYHTYKRYENFAIQQITIPPNQDMNFDKLFEIDIPRNGDFLHKMYIVITLPQLTPTSGTYAGWTNSIGHALIDYIELDIGGVTIQKHYGLFLELENELKQVRSSADKMIGKYLQMRTLQNNAISQTTYIIPLRFWFCEELSSSLPIIGLRFCPIKLRIQTKKFEECIVYDGTTPPNPVNFVSGNILSEYIFVEDNLREKFINQPHQYLIQGCLLNNDNPVTIENSTVHTKIDLNFSGLCSELIFVLREIESENNNDWFNFSNRNITLGQPLIPLLSKAKLIIDGSDRTELQDQLILSLVNSNRYHTNTTDKGIYIIPFSNNPEKWIPNGTMNFTVTDFATLYMEFDPQFVISNLFVFARTLNSMTIENGLIKIGFIRQENNNLMFNNFTYNN